MRLTRPWQQAAATLTAAVLLAGTPAAAFANTNDAADTRPAAATASDHGQDRAAAVQAAREAQPIDNVAKAVGAHTLHNRGIDGSGITVALLDTGVDEHADLGNVERHDVTGTDASGYDAYGHGTFLAGLIAGDGTSSNGKHVGAAPGADLLSVRAADDDGNTNLDWALDGIELITAKVEQGDVDVVVLALALPPTPGGTDPLEAAVERLWAAGAVVVVATGNHGTGIGSPATSPWAVASGAVDANRQVPSWSNTGESDDGLLRPDTYAPAVRVVSTIGFNTQIAAENPDALVGAGYLRGSGTSAAAAVTGGVAALALQDDPSLTNDQVKGALMSGKATGHDRARVLDARTVVRTPTSDGNSHLPAADADATYSDPALWAPSWDESTWGGYTWGAFTWGAYTWGAYTWGAYTWGAFTWGADSWAAFTWE